MNRKMHCAIAAGSAIVLSASAAFAVTPFSSKVITTFENDTDTFTPTNRDPLNAPGAENSQPPGANQSDPGGPPDFIAGEDWRDARYGGTGFIEEVPNNGTGFSGIFAPDGSAHFGIAQFQGTNDGIYGLQGRQNSSNPV